MRCCYAVTGENRSLLTMCRPILVKATVESRRRNALWAAGVFVVRLPIVGSRFEIDNDLFAPLKRHL